MSEPNPLVGLVMGSESDWPTMEAAAEILRTFGVPFEARVLSAHRTPDAMAEYARTARSRGLQVLVAGAGGAAHLPGMIAARTTLPVIGVPVPTKHLGGQDSLLSIVQMPAGVPVATVAIGGGKNAGLLAVQILATSDERLADALLDYKAELQHLVGEMDARVAKAGQTAHQDS
jgi:5-(carboxyamino)imidazole ribonucleotide mutase